MQEQATDPLLADRSMFIPFQSEQRKTRLRSSLDVVLTENERVRQFGFTSTELEREKKDLLSNYEKMAKEADKTESRSYADEYIRNFLTRECIPGIQKEYEIAKGYLPDITLEEINNLGKGWTTDENMVALITAQEKEGVKIPSEDQVKEIIRAVKSKKIDGICRCSIRCATSGCGTSCHKSDKKNR